MKEQTQLQQAAKEYAATKHHDKQLQEIVSWDFVAGANWQRNSVWHDASEEPKELKKILIINNLGEAMVTVPCYIDDWSNYEKWAYLSDLLPQND